MKIVIINGPNLNLLGKREPDIYGKQSFTSYFNTLKEKYTDINLSCFQSNSEGEIVSKIQDAGFRADGILLNAAAYTHTSIAIRDAVAAIPSEVLEIHLSNIHAREEFRDKTLIGSVCKGTISGLGLTSYQLGIDYFVGKKKD